MKKVGKNLTRKMRSVANGSLKGVPQDLESHNDSGSKESNLSSSSSATNLKESKSKKSSSYIKLREKTKNSDKMKNSIEGFIKSSSKKRRRSTSSTESSNSNTNLSSSNKNSPSTSLNDITNAKNNLRPSQSFVLSRDQQQLSETPPEISSRQVQIPSKSEIKKPKSNPDQTSINLVTPSPIINNNHVTEPPNNLKTTQVNSTQVKSVNSQVSPSSCDSVVKPEIVLDSNVNKSNSPPSGDWVCTSCKREIKEESDLIYFNLLCWHRKCNPCSRCFLPFESSNQTKMVDDKLYHITCEPLRRPTK